MRLPTRRHEKLKKYDDSLIYLTQEGFDRLKQKLERLKKSLPELIAETQRTAAYGDRSDNAEYKEVKSALRRTHWQILSTENQIKRTVVIKADQKKSGTAQIDRSSARSDNSEKPTESSIPESDPTNGRISNESPLGKIIIGKIGNRLRQNKNGIREYVVIEIN